MAWHDVLDHLGLVPRELGPLQVCLTRVLRSAAGVRVELYLQAAMDPLPPTALRLRWVDAAGAPAASELSVEVPALPGGRVLKLVLAALGQDATIRTPARVHAAPPSPEFVDRDVEAAEALPPPEVVEVWREGQPLPALAALQPIAAPEAPAAATGERRTCSSCGYRDVPGSRLCPACGAFWD